MSYRAVDIESLKAVDATSVDEGSVSSHLNGRVDAVVGGDRHASHPTRVPASSSRKWFLLVILTAVIALSVGFGVGFRDGRAEGRGSVALADAADEADASQTTEPPEEQALDDPEYEKPVEDETTPPSDSTGTGNSAALDGADDEADAITILKTEPPEEEGLDDLESERPVEDETRAPSDSTGSGTTGTSQGWPELVGIPGDEAKQFLEDLGQGYQVFIIAPGMFAPRDLQLDRILLFVDDVGLVKNVPGVGR